MKTIFTIAAVLLITVQAGCATKTYGRQSDVTNFERDTMTCREIDLEIAKTNGFISHVNSDDKFDGRQFLAIMGDFGIGNSMERSGAIESANKRISDLTALRTKRNCSAQAPASN